MSEGKMTEESKGYFGKFIIQKADGSPIDPNAEYFVLRLDNDVNAVDAVMKYAELTFNKELYNDIASRFGRYVR